MLYLSNVVENIPFSPLSAMVSNINGLNFSSHHGVYISDDISCWLIWYFELFAEVFPKQWLLSPIPQNISPAQRLSQNLWSCQIQAHLSRSNLETVGKGGDTNRVLPTWLIRNSKQFPSNLCPFPLWTTESVFPHGWQPHPCPASWDHPSSLKQTLNSLPAYIIHQNQQKDVCSKYLNTSD